MEKAIDRTGIKIGMWIFLYSEIILFGGLFVLYAVYFHRYPENSAKEARSWIVLSVRLTPWSC